MYKRQIKSIKSKITDLDKMKIEEQKKAVRSGYDMDIIPSDLATFGGEAKRLLQDLQTRNERLFLVTILIIDVYKRQARDPDHFAVKQYRKYKLAAGKTAKSILISCGARLAPFDIAELRELMSYDEMELDTLSLIHI